MTDEMKIFFTHYLENELSETHVFVSFSQIQKHKLRTEAEKLLGLEKGKWEGSPLHA